MKERIRYSSLNLANFLTSGRSFFQKNSENQLYYDPRFLVFEYVFNILIRKRQVEMVNSFLKSIEGRTRVFSVHSRFAFLFIFQFLI